MPKKIQTHLKQETWRCSDRDAGSVWVTSLFVLGFFLRERGGGEIVERGRAPELESCKTLAAGSHSAGIYLSHAWSNSGGGDEDHIGSKLSRSEDLQGLGRRDRETCYFMGRKLTLSILPTTYFLPAEELEKEDVYHTLQ